VSVDMTISTGMNWWRVRAYDRAGNTNSWSSVWNVYVDTNQLVAVATVGTILGDDKNQLKIKKAQLRGLDSNGMICSSQEIGLPKINDGIMELDDSIGVWKASRCAEVVQ